MTGQDGQVRVVDGYDLEHPWNCEGCGREFQVGDVVYGEPHCMVGDTMSIEDFRCLGCQEAAA